MMYSVQTILTYLKQDFSLPEDTVDTLLHGENHHIVTGIAVMFMPTIAALKKAATLNCNLILAHEGLFFNHSEKKYALDTVHKEKEAFLNNLSLNIFRLHDLIHMYTPDMITAGLTDVLFPHPNQLTVHPTYTVVELVQEETLGTIRQHVKQTLSLPVCRYVGEDNHLVKRIGIFVGYRGNGEHVIPKIVHDQLDLVIYGEGFEWETPEYSRDSSFTSRSTSVIVLGHYESEAPGMKLFTAKISAAFDDLKVHYIDSSSPFSYD